MKLFLVHTLLGHYVVRAEDIKAARKMVCYTKVDGDEVVELSTEGEQAVLYEYEYEDDRWD